MPEVELNDSTVDHEISFEEMSEDPTTLRRNSI